MSFRWGLAGLLAVGLAACGGDSMTGPSDPAALRGPWLAVSAAPAGGPTIPAPGDLGTFSVTFAVDRLSARVDCNTCGGVYTAGPGSISTPPMACTLAFCASTAEFGTIYTGLLQGATAWRVEGDTLLLSSPAGALRFRR